MSRTQMCSTCRWWRPITYPIIIRRIGQFDGQCRRTDSPGASMAVDDVAANLWTHAGHSCACWQEQEQEVA